MKILHVVQGYSPALGGTELLIQKLSEQLVRQHGDEVTVFTTNAAKNCAAFWLQSELTLPPGTETINGVTVRRFPIFNRFGGTRHRISKFADWASLPFNDWFRAFFNGPIVFGMTEEIARFKPDVIGASSFPFLHMHYALAGGKRSNKPVVLHGALHPADTWGFDRPMIYKAIQEADAYIANSQFEQQYLTGRGISANLIHVIGVGVDPDQFVGASGQELRNAYGWSNDPVITFVGQLNKRKGVQRLLEAMSQVWATSPQAKLLLAGSDSPSANQLVQEADKLSQNIPHRVVVTRDFSEAEKAKIFAASDILVLPSIEESFGIVLLEAWACYKPVIGMRVGAISSIVTDRVDGLLVTPDCPDELAHSIVELLNNPALRMAMGEAGHSKMRQYYTWDVVASKFRAVYELVQRRTDEIR